MSYMEEVGFSVWYSEGDSWEIDRYTNDEEYQFEDGLLYVSNIDGDNLVIYKDWIRVDINYEYVEEDEPEKEDYVAWVEPKLPTLIHSTPESSPQTLYERDDKPAIKAKLEKPIKR